MSNTLRGLCGIAVISSLVACTSAEVRESCDNDNPCLRGLECVSGICVDPDDEDSGRRDIGRHDADGSTTDLTPRDSSADLTPPDGGGPDLTPQDGAIPDVTPADGAIPDLSPVDAGADTGVVTVCAAQGAACELDSSEIVRDDGAWYCARVNGYPGPVCAQKCEDPGNASDCPSGSWCFEVTGGGSTEQMCLPGQCTDWTQGATQCSGGTCVELGNGSGQCYQGGTVAVGGTCEADAIGAPGRCVSGAWCDVERGADTGTCLSLCGFWDSVASCPAGQGCGLFSWEQGICQASTEQEPFDTCDTPGDWCNDRSRCFDFGTSNRCGVYCRRGAADCAGIQYLGAATVCNWNAFSDSVTHGICLPPCSSASDCVVAAGETCMEGVCVRTCTEDRDCGGGNICLTGICKPRP